MTTSHQIDSSQYVNEVDRLTAEVRALKRQLRHTQRLASVGTMTSMVVHEFNNLLTPIISYAQLAQQDPRLTPKAISRAVTSGQRAADICSAILGMARDERSEPTVVDLADVVRSSLTAMARDPQRDGIELICNVPDGLRINGRRVELQQAILNLLINARWAVLKRLAEPPRIVISAENVGESVFLDVTDNGIGIEPQDCRRIFEPFYSTRDSDGGRDGNGLGLALCRDILDGMGGDIAVESRPHIGTTFTLRLPA
ncbi:MAG: HAMP domain-containing histidine kinase [Phycisphaerae bacterium]|nr:HAMP domain-containing histidine kinase [Phycisphaerae bacterium]